MEDDRMGSFLFIKKTYSIANRKKGKEAEDRETGIREQTL